MNIIYRVLLFTMMIAFVASVPRAQNTLHKMEQQNPSEDEMVKRESDLWNRLLTHARLQKFNANLDKPSVAGVSRMGVVNKRSKDMNPAMWVWVPSRGGYMSLLKHDAMAPGDNENNAVKILRYGK